MQDPAPGDEFRRSVAAVRAATERMMVWDGGPWKALLSSRDDVVLLRAFGGHVGDRAEIDARFDQPARAWRSSAWRPGSVRNWPARPIRCGTVGCGWPGAPATAAYRVTHVFRREADGWRVVLRHADPLVEFRGPESVLPQDG